MIISPSLKMNPEQSPLCKNVARLFAVVAWLGVLLQLWLSIRMGLINGKTVGGGLIAFFGYFTVLTNIFVALVFTAGSLRPRSWIYGISMVGCSTTAILIVGIGYHFLLREIWDPQGPQWVADILLHYVVPVGALLHWLVYSRQEQTSGWAPLSWCCYPILYFVYVMMRGEITHSYPYPFIDVTTIGYAQTITNSAAFLLGFVAMSYGILKLRKAVRSGVDVCNEGRC